MLGESENQMKYEISKSYLCRRDRWYDDFYLIKATNDNGVSKYYEGYSLLYNNLPDSTSDMKCSSLNGDTIEKSPIYQTSSKEDGKRPILTQFIHGVKMERTFSIAIANDLIGYTGFSPASFDEFMKILSTGKSYLNVKSADLFSKSADGDELIGIKCDDVCKDIPNEEEYKNTFNNIHLFMSEDDICYYLLMKVNNIYVPFLLREFNPMA